MFKPKPGYAVNKLELSVWGKKDKDWTGTQSIIEKIKTRDREIELLAVGSINTYIPSIRRFLNHFKMKPRKLTSKLVKTYFKELKSDRVVRNSKTLRRYYAAVKWLYGKILHKTCPKISFKSCESTQRPIISDVEFSKL